MQKLNTDESSKMLNECRKVLLNYQKDKRNITSAQEMDRIQDKLVITLAAIYDIMNEKDQQRLVSTIEAFGMSKEWKIVANRIENNDTIVKLMATR